MFYLLLAIVCSGSIAISPSFLTSKFLEIIKKLLYNL